MKVGTDGILLGAWAGTGNPEAILDIGWGCGLVAMMLAQWFELAKIRAVEICPDAAQQARQNFRECPWADRLQLIEGDARSLLFAEPCDLVVANQHDIFMARLSRKVHDKRLLQLIGRFLRGS